MGTESIRFQLTVAVIFVLFMFYVGPSIAFRRFSFSVNKISKKLVSITPNNAVIRYASTRSGFGARSSNDDSANKLKELLNDLRSILSTPGLASTSLKRSIQITAGLGKVFREYSLDKSKFLDAKGDLSIPRVLRRVFEELGATYIKLGQFIASSPTLFPAEYVEEFQACLDRTPTVPYETIRRIIQSDLKRPIITVFSSIDPIPVASASIAQVHRGRLRDGTDVAIKVRKPGVDNTLQADLAFLLVATKLLEFINPSLSSFSLANIIADIRDSMLEELDFRKEADNLLNFRRFLRVNGLEEEATAPAPFLEVSGERVLVMEFLDGVPLVDLEGIRRYTTQPEATLLSALRTWAMSVAVNERFHGDIHAGNLLVLKSGRIGFIDFGIVGKISDKFRTAVGNLFNAFVADDYQGIASALVDMGATKGAVDRVRFGEELKTVVESITQLQPQVMITMDGVDTVEARLTVDERETTQIVLQIVSVAEKNGLKLPREFGLVLKQALYFDRYQKLLAPDMDPLRDVRVRSRLAEEMAVTSSRRNDNMNSNPQKPPRVIIDVDPAD